MTEADKPNSTPAEKPAKLVSIDAVDYNTAGNIVFSGQGNEGNTARVYIDNNIIGGITAGNSGNGAVWIQGIMVFTVSGSTSHVQGNQIGGTLPNSLQSTPTVSNSSKVYGRCGTSIL